MMINLYNFICIFWLTTLWTMKIAIVKLIALEKIVDWNKD